MWKNKENHKGFDVASNRAYNYIEKYVSNYVPSEEGVQKVIYIVGHGRHIKTSIGRNPGSDFYHLNLWQTPSFLMMDLASLAAEESRYFLGEDVTFKYISAKTSFISTSGGTVILGGMAHPHTPETYYLIARNDFKEID